MKIALIIGSPRVKSDSTRIAEKAIEAIPGGQKEVKKFVINSITAKGCQACFSCKGKTETCVVKDELASALAAVQEADFVVVTSPIYIGDVTAQLKLFVDRSFAWYKPDFQSNPSPSRLAPGKKLLFIVTQGNPDEGTYRTNVVDMLTGYFGSHGFKAASLVAVIPHDPSQVEAALERHFVEAAKIVAGL